MEGRSGSCGAATVTSAIILCEARSFRFVLSLNPVHFDPTGPFLAITFI